jgi:hypothetical protein
MNVESRFNDQPIGGCPDRINISRSPMSLGFPQCFIPFDNLVSRLHWGIRGTSILGHSKSGWNDAIDERGENVVVRFKVGWGCGRHGRARLRERKDQLSRDQVKGQDVMSWSLLGVFVRKDKKGMDYLF